MFIKLTRVTKVLNDKGKVKLDKYEKDQNKIYDPPKDGYDRTAQWYIDQGMGVPDDLAPIELDEYDLVFDDSDYEEKKYGHICNTEALSYIDDYVGEGTTAKSTIVYQTNIISTETAGYIFAMVAETPDQILKKINK